jgi:hypothetical protein
VPGSGGVRAFTQFKADKYQFAHIHEVRKDGIGREGVAVDVDIPTVEALKIPGAIVTVPRRGQPVEAYLRAKPMPDRIDRADRNLVNGRYWTLELAMVGSTSSENGVSGRWMSKV